MSSARDAQRARRDDERAARLAALHARIVERVATLTDGEQWRAWLDFATRFHSYSFNNLMLIWSQRPDATFVAGIRRWNTMGRHVRKGEKGISVLAPVIARTDKNDTTDALPPHPAGSAGPPGPEDLTGATVTAYVEAALARDGAAMSTARVLRGFRIVTVFDIAQTDGDPVDIPRRPAPSDVDPVLLTGEAPPRVWDALTSIGAGNGYRVERGDCGGPNGYIRYTDSLIKVRDDVDDAQAVKTLLHELGHMFLHEPADFDTGDTRRCRGTKEVEAESVAFLTAAHVELDTSDYTFGYVTGWAEQAAADTGRAPHEIVQATGTRVVRAAATLTAALDEALGQAEPPVPASLVQRVYAATQTTAELRTQAAAGQAVPSDMPAAGLAFRAPASRASTIPRPPLPPPGAAGGRHR